MAGIGKNSASSADKQDSIEELKKQFNTSHDKIAKIINNRKDKNDLSREEQAELRREYLKMANIAKTLSSRINDEEEAKKFAAYAPQLTERAQQYGSSVSSAVPKTTFDDVKGLENVKKLVKSFTFMAQNPDVLKYYKL
ncbi:MAG: hypothetical protein K2K39_01995, partial [Clostridia bacterium]|nr:hypothetical protein [Clostridia bacterium]